MTCVGMIGGQVGEGLTSKCDGYTGGMFRFV